MPKELDEKVTIADLQYERQARDRASSLRPASCVLRWPRWRMRSSVCRGVHKKTFLWERSRRKFKYSSMRPSRRVLRGPRRRSPSLLRYTVSQASKVERIGSRFLELVCSLPNVSLSAPCRRGDCRV